MDNNFNYQPEAQPAPQSEPQMQYAQPQIQSEPQVQYAQPVAQSEPQMQYAQPAPQSEPQMQYAQPAPQRAPQTQYAQPAPQSEPQVQYAQPATQSQPQMQYAQPAVQQPQMQYAQPAVQQTPQMNYAQPNININVAQQASHRPVLQLANGRGLLMYILLGIITCGIYPIVIMSRIADEINITASRYDGRKTMPYFAMCAVAPLTLMILPLVWIHNLSNRIGNEARRRGYQSTMSATCFWLWNVLGSLIIVGPFIYWYKFFKAMNQINTSYNMYG